MEVISDISQYNKWAWKQISFFPDQTLQALLYLYYKIACCVLVTWHTSMWSKWSGGQGYKVVPVLGQWKGCLYAYKIENINFHKPFCHFLAWVWTDYSGRRGKLQFLMTTWFKWDVLFLRHLHQTNPTASHVEKNIWAMIFLGSHEVGRRYWEIHNERKINAWTKEIYRYLQY